MGNSKKKSMHTIVSRYWGYVVSKEHMYDSFRRDLLNFKVPLAVSPLHCPDDVMDDSPFKHYHVQIDFEELVPFTRARSFAVAMNCGGAIAEPIINPYLHFRYLTHLDNPEKEQFHFLHPDLYNGYEIPTPNLTDLECKIFIDNFIEDYSITEFRDLKNYFRKSKKWKDFQIYCYILNHTNLCYNLVKANLFYNR